MSKQINHIYEFGEFRVETAERLLLRDGRPISLTPKVFETLLVLIRRSGHAVEKDDLLKQVWPDEFVEEANLARNIWALRKALGDENGEHKYIETVPKLGYRFVAPVTEVEPDEPALVIKRRFRARILSQEEETNEDLPIVRSATAERELLPASSRMPRWISRELRWIVLMAGVLLLGIVATSFYFRDLNRTTPAENISAVGSIAVLPFKPIGAEANDEYLGLGLTDALITKLSNLKEIVVRPSGAVRKFAGQDPVVAGRELGVDAVLDGNVQRIDRQIRVTLQLVRVRDGRLLWGETFDQQFSDIFGVQDAISEHVALALKPGLTGQERSLLTKRYTTNADAHHAYVKGRFFWNRRTPGDLKEAIKHFNQAVEKDPSYALAYAGLADAHSLLADYSGAPAKESYAMARDAALKALKLDDELAEAHASLAYVKMSFDWDWQVAEQEYKRAIVLNPNYATARQWYSEYLTAMGRHDDALGEIRRAREIDPLSPVINAGEVWVLYFARRYDEAIEHGQRVIEMSPEFAQVHEYLKRCYDQKGMYREAVAARQMRRKLDGYDVVETAALRGAASATSREAYWKSRLKQEIDDSRREPAATFDMAEIWAQLGEKERAFEWLERAYNERHYALMYLKVAPNLDLLRSDPKFTDLLRRVRLGS